ncbi:MAG: hypothetical protein HY258_07940 [Chloroflexi bacterium]|nr:hypothetical protein [Chloroflexota bacterium]
MTLRLSAFFVLTLLLAACQPSTIETPPSPTSTGVPLIEPSATPTLIPPTSAPTETETLVPAPRVFTEGFDGSLPNWSFAQMDNGQPASGPEVRSGFLVLNLSASNQWVYSIYDAQEYADVRVDAQVGNLSGDGGAVGVVCRYSETDGWYEFDVYPDGTYTLLFGQWLAQGVARYKPMYRGSSDKIKNDANEIGLSCEGDVLTPFINSVQMRKWQETRYGLKNGRIGLTAASFESVPLMVGFDWVKVSEP